MYNTTHVHELKIHTPTKQKNIFHQIMCSLRMCYSTYSLLLRRGSLAFNLGMIWACAVLPTSALKRFKSLSRVLAHARKGYSILTNRIYIVKWGREREKRRTNKLNGMEWNGIHICKMLVKCTRQKRKECLRARARARSHVWELVAEQAQFHACAFERTTHTNP